MPTYEYECERGHRFERVQKMTDKAVTRCPVCGAKASRVISGGQGLIFKGSGFYITDYGKDGKGPRKDQDAGKPAEVKTEAAATAPAETPAKPASSETPKPKRVKPAKPDSA